VKILTPAFLALACMRRRARCDSGDTVTSSTDRKLVSTQAESWSRKRLPGQHDFKHLIDHDLKLGGLRRPEPPHPEKRSWVMKTRWPPLGVVL